MRAAHRRALGVLLAVVIVGCASVPPDRVALDTLVTLQKTTATAMSVANDLFVAGQISKEQVLTLIGYYNEYMAASKLAGAALLAIASTQTTPVTQPQVDAIMAPVKAAAAKVKVP